MPLLGRGMLANWSDVGIEDRPRYYEWHLEHMIGRIGVPGFYRGRRYRALEAGHDFFQFYELADSAVMDSEAYHSLASTHSAATTAVLGTIRNSARTVAEKVASVGGGQGGVLGTVRFEIDRSRVTGRPKDSLEVKLHELEQMPLVCGAHLYRVRQDFEETSHISHIALIEGLAHGAVNAACDFWMSDQNIMDLCQGGAQVRGIFQLEYALMATDLDGML